MDNHANRVLPVKVMDWFKDDVFRLIDLYRDRPCLWDNDDIDRRDKAKKEESWNEISDILHVERAEVERKMKSLSTQFYREYKRKIKIETETGSDEGFRSKWFAYERLSFLSRRVKDRPTICYYGSEEVENGASGDDGLGDIVKFSQMVDDNFTSNDQQCFPVEDHHPPKPNLKRKYSPDMYYDEPFHKNINDKDEFQIFGEFVACKLRSLSSPLVRSTVQHSISDIIYQAELGNFNHFSAQLQNHSFVNCSTRDSNPPCKKES